MRIGGVKNMSQLNHDIILLNINETFEELEGIKKKLESGVLDEVEFQSLLQHVYHHLNFAWNIRNETTNAYSNLSDDDFYRWRKYPEDLFR